MVAPKNYQKDDFIHYIQIRSNENRFEGIGKTSTTGQRNYPNKDMYEVSFEDIENMNLNKIGNEIPYASMNVINIERYMLYFWSLIMDSDCILLYLHLWEYCDRTNGVDICYPKMNELQERLGVSKPTLIKKIKMLEENNFLVQIHRLNKKDNNRETSPIFKLRQTIPMLSREQYQKLPKLMQKKHDDYMKKFVKDYSMNMFSPLGSDTIQQLIEQKGDKIITSKIRSEIEKVISNEQEIEYIRENLSSKMKETLIESSQFYCELQSCGMSKPASEFLFKDCITTYDPESKIAYIITPDKSSRDFILNNLTDHQKDILAKTLINMYKEVYDYQVFTRKNYILKVMKGT